MKCRDCKHKEHAAGQCKSCPCGESEVSQMTSQMGIWDFQYEQRGAVSYGYDRGHQVPPRSNSDHEQKENDL